MNCPCCSKKTYEHCCKPFHSGTLVPNAPEQLMRARYSAFALTNADFLLKTSSKKLLSGIQKEELIAFCKANQFVKLDIVDTTDSTVEFIAHIIQGDKYHRQHELSYFIKENQQWVYDWGEVQPVSVTKLTRNTLCPCGSAKKFKNCHL